MGGLGTGGSIGSDPVGGAGGAGVYGGGGGGACGIDGMGHNSGAGVGGGGSSRVPAGGSVSANSSSLPSEITISSTVPPPAACTGDSATTAYNTVKTITFSCTGTGLTYSLVSGPAHGTLGAINGNQVTYTPNAGFAGQDSFVVQAQGTTGAAADAPDRQPVRTEPARSCRGGRQAVPCTVPRRARMRAPSIGKGLCR